MFEFLVHCIVFIQRFIHCSIAWEFAENGKTTPLIDWNWIWHLGKHWRNHLSAQFWMFVVDKIVFFLNYGLQHGTLFQVHKLCHIFCFFTCYVLSMGKRTNAQIDTFFPNMDSTMAQDPHVQVVDSNNRDRGWDTDRQLCRSPIVSCALPLGGETPTSLP